jgi:hypothetical protein
MNADQYAKISLWPLSSHLAEIQDRIESARLMAAAIHHGKAVSPQKYAGELAVNLVEIADWIGHVQRQHAPFTQTGLTASAGTLKTPLSPDSETPTGVTKPLSECGSERLEITKPADRAAAGGGRLNPPLN